MVKTLAQTTQKAVFLVPCNWLNSKKIKEAKNYLLAQGLVKFIYFNYDGVFDDNSSTACIMLFDKNDDSNAVESYIRNEKEELKYIGKVDYSSLRKSDFWFPLLLHSGDDSNEKSLSVFAKVSRGIATGCNRFFLINKETALKYNIFDNTKFCISNAKQIKGDVLTREIKESLIDSKNNVLLFSPSISSENVNNYIQYGESINAQKGYICSHRDKWYLVEDKEPADILIAPFSRTNYRFILNDIKAITLQSYYGIYVQDKNKVRELWEYLNSEKVNMWLKERADKIGDGLMRLSVNTVMNIPMP